MAKIDYETVLADLTRQRDDLNGAISAIERILSKEAPRSRATGPSRGTVTERDEAILAYFQEAPRTPRRIMEIRDALERANLSTNFNTVKTAMLRGTKQGLYVSHGRGSYILKETTTQ
jgi:hypothetical protein